MSHFGRSGPPDIADTYSLLILNITFRTSADDLFPLFDKYGKVVDIFIPRDRRTGESRGFAFVRYKYADEAQKAVERLDGRVVDGREMTVQDDYNRDRDYRRRSRSRSVDRFSRDRYSRGRDRDSRYRSRSRSFSPDYSRGRGRGRHDERRYRSRSRDSASPPRRKHSSRRSPSPVRSPSPRQSLSPKRSLTPKGSRSPRGSPPRRTPPSRDESPEKYSHEHGASPSPPRTSVPPQLADSRMNQTSLFAIREAIQDERPAAFSSIFFGQLRKFHVLHVAVGTYTFMLVKSDWEAADFGLP
ncbi:hypothetical protein ACFE04_023324 [Oxalis oulophora]